MDLKRQLSEAAQRHATEQPHLMTGLIDEVNASDWCCTITYVDPDKGGVMVVHDVPLPNHGGTSFRPTLPKRGDFVSFFFAKGSVSKPFILGVYTVHDLQVSNNFLTMGRMLGGP